MLDVLNHFAGVMGYKHHIVYRLGKARKAEYAEYVRKLEAVAKAAEEAVPHDYITPELHEALADWRSNE